MISNISDIMTSDPDFRDRVAVAVHHAVTELTEDDGMGHCDLYAVAGVVLLRRLTLKPYQIQLGSLSYLVDPPGNGWMNFDARNGGLERSEFHAWLGLAGKTRRDIQKLSDNQAVFCEIGELIDLSTRHFRAMTEQFQGRKSASWVGDLLVIELDTKADIVSWTRPDEPPLYVWMNESEMREDIRYSADFHCTAEYYANLASNPSIVKSLDKLAFDRFFK